MKRILIQTSGVLEKYGVTVDQVLSALDIYSKGFAIESVQQSVLDGDMQEFLLMLLQMNCTWCEVVSLLKKAEAQTKAYMFEIEVKKAAGTYDQWIEEITIQNEECGGDVANFFHEFKKTIPPLKFGNLN